MSPTITRKKLPSALVSVMAFDWLYTWAVIHLHYCYRILLYNVYTQLGDPFFGAINFHWPPTI